MSTTQWWSQLKRIENTIKNIREATLCAGSLLQALQPILKLPQPPNGALEETAKKEFKAIISKLEDLIGTVEEQKEHDTLPDNQVIYDLFLKLLNQLIPRIDTLKQPASPLSDITSAQTNRSGIAHESQNLPAPNNLIAPSKTATAQTATINDISLDQTNSLAQNFFKLHKEYTAIMEDRKQNAKTYQSIKNKAADEQDRLNCFIKVVDHWMSIRFAFENINEILTLNLENTDIYVEKKPLPLQFRIEKNPNTGTYRFIKASLKTSTVNDQTVFDLLDDTLNLKILKRGAHVLIDHSDVIRFVRLHSSENNLLQFRGDALSRIAEKMYNLFTSMATGLRVMERKSIGLLNRTPMNELEYAFFGINPEDCKELIRYKFQSLLPGLNEDHYYLQKDGKKRERKERTRDTMDSYRKKFQDSSQTIFSSVKSTVAVSFWLRKLITIVLSNEKQKKADTENPPKNPTLDVGISNTIGDEDIMNFYIDPDDIISSEGVLQRADRADKWLMVNKSEKLHRLLKKDFLSILHTFVQADLNVALKRFGLAPIDFKNDLIPEVEERLADIDRINIIRSGILGTGMTTLEDYCNNTIFHKTFRTYFNEKRSTFTNYPYKEKVRSIAEGLIQSKTAILQMKYRKILLVQSELTERIENLGKALKKEKGGGVKEIKQQYQVHLSLNNILERVKMIMELAKPSLKNVQLETDDMVIKAVRFEN